MAVGAARNFFRIAGRIAMSPSNLATAFPHGGTALALYADLIFNFGARRLPITAEEFGGAPVDDVFLPEEPSLTGILREYDFDALTNIFPNTATGSNSGRALIRGQVFNATTGTPARPPGSLASANTFSLIVTPRATDHNPALLLFNVIPLIVEQAVLRFGIGESKDAGFPVLFRCIPNSAGNLYELGMLEDLTL